jgi:putative hemolysin
MTFDSIVLKIIGIFISILLVGLFAGLEIAFISANKLNIELKKKQGRSSGIILSRFMDHPAKFIGTTLIGINIVLVIYGILIDNLLEDLWKQVPGLANRYLILLFNTLLSTAIILLLGEFLPKAIFRAKSDTVLAFFAPLAQFFYNLLYPIASFFIAIAAWILKYLFNVHINEKREAFSRVDLEHFFQQSKEQDEDNQELNSELFENALSFPSVKVRQCLIPRKEIEAVDARSSLDDVKKKFIESKLSKLVVYENNIDSIVGYIHQLDLFKNPSDLRSVLLPIPAVPESMSATDLIGKLTKERKSIAWVVDEFGGTAGIITMEDLLEEIFGEIKDEYDTEEFVEKQISDQEYIFSGRLELDYLNEKYEFNFPEDASETLSGYIIDQHETIPKLKERIIVGNYEFDILNVSDTRIEMVKIKRLDG